MAAQKDVIPGFSPSKAAFARYLVRSLILKDIQKVPLTQLSEEIVSHAPPKENGLPEKSGKDPDVAPGDLTVGIVGAGISGLYTALILQSLGIKYEILEANPKRIGGRLYTHYFSDPNAEGNESKHDYYDIGAMSML
jgi:threonine dehydrogenase-like Zn-dependent dehydrogenase